MTHPMIHNHLMRNSFPTLGTPSVDSDAGLE